MKRAFQIRTADGPFDDPFVYLRFYHTGRAVLFDLGDLGPLGSRELLRITDVFVTHTHMDHFIGFDRLLRVHLNRDSVLRFYGPEGFLDRIQGRLSGYTWNLTGSYPLSVQAAEVARDGIRTAAFRAGGGFAREDGESRPWTGVLCEEAAFRVKAVVLDHAIACLAFRLEEKVRVRIRSGALERRGLVPGPWLSDLKEAVVHGEPPEREIRARTPDGAVVTTIGDLQDIYTVTPGGVLAYVVDAAGSDDNIRRIVALAQNADLLYIEAAFSQDDSAIAGERSHLTAARAGQVATLAAAARTRLIHISPRYTGREGDLLREARHAAGGGTTVEGGWKRWAR